MFSWDPGKAQANHEKHGVAFEEAATVFADPDGLDWEDLEHSHDEKRRKRLGAAITGRIVMVAYTIRGTSDGKETVRIISARQASRKERKTYTGQQD